MECMKDPRRTRPRRGRVAVMHRTCQRLRGADGRWCARARVTRERVLRSHRRPSRSHSRLPRSRHWPSRSHPRPLQARSCKRRFWSRGAPLECLDVAIDAEDDAIVCEADDARPWAAAITLQVVAIAFEEVAFFLGGVAHCLDVAAIRLEGVAIRSYVVAIQSEEGAIRSQATAIRSQAAAIRSGGRAIQVETGPFGPKPLACRRFVLAIRAHGYALEPEGDGIAPSARAIRLGSCPINREETASFCPLRWTGLTNPGNDAWRFGAPAASIPRSIPCATTRVSDAPLPANPDRVRMIGRLPRSTGRSAEHSDP